MFDSITKILVDALIPSVTLMTPVIGLLMVSGLKLIKQRTKNEMVEWALTRLSETIKTVVANHMQVSRDLVVHADDPKKAIKALAVSDVYNQIPEAVKRAAEMGIADVDTFIRQKIEKEVLSIKVTLPTLRPLSQAKGE